MIKVVFFGTPDFVVPVCQAIFEAKGCSLQAVVTAPGKPTGRKQVLTPSPVKVWAQEHQIPVLTPEKLDDLFTYHLLLITYHLFVVAAYGKIIPQSILDLPKYDALGVHPSLLPKYRGTSPVQAAIVAGDKETGVTIYQMDNKMDHGPIAIQIKETIKPENTAGGLYHQLFQKAAETLIKILPNYIDGKIQLREQDHTQATFTRILKKEDGFIPYGVIAPKRGYTSKRKLIPYDLEPTPENLERFIRAMTPWPGTFTNVKIKNQISKRLKILKAHLEEGRLVLDQVQLEGKKPVSWQQFQEAYPEAKLVP